MEQKDYLLREIEKIGLILRSILSKLAGKQENLSITIENHFDQAKQLLLNDTGFDLDWFIPLDESASKDYISRFKGLNAVNIELLAEFLVMIGTNENPDNKRIFLQKALRLYELSKITDKTFSFEREGKIAWIKDEL